MNDEFETVRIIVEVSRRKSDGAVKSGHVPASDTDVNIMKGWPSSGLVQVAHALSVEALRREAWTMAATMLSTGMRSEEVTVEAVSERLVAQMLEFTKTNATGAAEKALSF